MAMLRYELPVIIIGAHNIRASNSHTGCFWPTVYTLNDKCLCTQLIYVLVQVNTPLQWETS